MLRMSLVVLTTLASACKPAEEPPRRLASAVEIAPSPSVLGPPTGNVRVTERVAIVTDPNEAPPVIGDVAHVDAEAPDTSDATENAAEAIVDAVAEVGPDVVFPTRPEDLPPELIAALAADYPATVRDEARRLNKLGLEAHKKLALDEAAETYTKALEGYPPFPFARYNLACARALQKRNDEALFHLAVLRHLSDERSDKAARERLEAARIDGDFELMRDDPRFRALTGATNVLVTWVGGGVLGRKEALVLVKALRDAKWPAKAATTPWQSLVPGNVVRVRAGDAIAEAAASAMAKALQDAALEASAAGWPIELGAPLPPDAPPIIVIIAGTADANELPEVAPAEPDPAIGAPTTPEPTGYKTLADVLGKRLRAERSGEGGSEHHTLELKATGFFAWDIALPGGVRKRRAGRWSGNEERLSLSFKETTETPAADDPAAPPTITVEEGMSRALRVEVGAQGVTLDGVVFR